MDAPEAANPEAIPPTDPGCNGARVVTDEAGNPIELPEQITPDELAFLLRFLIEQIARVEARCVAILKNLGDLPDEPGPSRPSD